MRQVLSVESGSSVKHASPPKKCQRKAIRPGLRNSSKIKKRQPFEQEEKAKAKKVKTRKQTRLQLV